MPAEIRDFAALFDNLQGKRHDADYNPVATFHKSEIESDIAEAHSAITAFEATPIEHRRAFAAHVLFRARSS